MTNTDETKQMLGEWIATEIERVSGIEEGEDKKTGTDRVVVLGQLLNDFNKTDLNEKEMQLRAERERQEAKANRAGKIIETVTKVLAVAIPAFITLAGITMGLKLEGKSDVLELQTNRELWRQMMNQKTIR